MKYIGKIFMMMAAAATGMTAFTSCDDDKMYDMNHDEANIIGTIAFNFEGKLTMPVGAELPLDVTILPEEAASTGIIYRTSDASVAYIDENGVLHCVSEGIANVSALPSIGFGATAELEVTVVDHVVYAESMTITGEKELAQYHYLGDEFKLVPVILPEDHTYSYVEWSTSDPTVIDIDGEGNVICGRVGSATITAVTKAPDTPGITGTLTLTVSESADVDDIEIAPYDEPVCIDLPFELDVTYYPDYGNHATVEWTSSDEAVALVSKGRVVPTGFGSATITGICPSGKAKSIVINVTPGWRVWDPSNKFSGWTPAGDSFKFEYTDDYFQVKMPVSGSNYRADIKYNCSDAAPVTFHFGEYPVIALRTTIPDGGRNTFDVVSTDGVGGGNPQCNFGRFGTGNPIRLDDGSNLLYVDWSGRTQYSLTGYTSFKTFQLKVADMVVADTPSDTYRVYWIRTFKSVDEMREFAEAEVAAGK